MSKTSWTTSPLKVTFNPNYSMILGEFNVTYHQCIFPEVPLALPHEAAAEPAATWLEPVSPARGLSSQQPLGTGTHNKGAEMTSQG